MSVINDSERLPGSVEVAEESIDASFWYARGIYRSRHLFLLLLLFGASWGAWDGARQPRFRTSAALRMANPSVGYHQRAYWEPLGRTVQCR